MVADLTDAEKRLIAAATAGEIADYSTGEPDRDDPSDGESWSEARTLRAEVVRRLCLGLEPKWLIDPKGIRVFGAKIAGDLDLDSTTIAIPLEMVGCHIAGEVILRDASTKRLDFSGSCLGKGLRADGVTVNGEVFLSNGFGAKGAVRLLGADIGGNLACHNGTFENPGGDALSADRMTVKGNVFLSDEFSAKGEVRLPGADIGGDLDCHDGTFENPGGHALAADGITIKGSVILSYGFSAKGEVRLLGANISGNLDCHKGAFENHDGDALTADGMTVKGDVFLRDGFSAKGAVRLLGANIGGDLACRNGTFENPDSHALAADGITVKGNVFLREGFCAKGAVRLLGANIGGNLDCDSARFETNYQTKTPHGSIAFSLQTARVTGVFRWRNLKILGPVRLAHAKVGILFDAPNSWPDPGNLDLNGFEYEEFAAGAPTDAEARKNWLRRQPSFRSQPYEQAVRVLRRMGHDRDAREIAIAKRNALRDSGLMGRMNKLWNHFLEVTVAYGYKPWRALWIAGVFYLLGMMLFDAGFSFGLVSPADSRVFLQPAFVESGGTWLPPEYPRFNAPIYSLDVFLPIVDLHQESRWLPNMRNGWGWALWGYMWLHIMAGWVLTSVFVAALTGLMKKD